MDITTTVKIEINNTQVKDPFTSLSIRESMDDHHFFEVRFGLEKDDVKVLELLEKDISQTIKISFELDSKIHLFKGIITRSKIDKGWGSYGELVLEGFSPTILLDDNKDCNYFTNLSLSNVVDEIIPAFALGIKTINQPAFSGKFESLMQYRETSYQFLKRLAKIYGEWFFYNGTDLNFGTYNPGDAIDLELGYNIFEINLLAELQPLKFKENYYSYSEATTFMVQSGDDGGLDKFGREIKNKSNSVFSNQPVSLNTNHINNQSDLSTMYDASFSGRAGKMVVLTAKSRRSDLQVGSKINIKDYGSFIITTIVHSCESLSVYSNTFRAIPSALMKPPHFANDIADYPAIEIQDAKVTSNNDPDGLGRVKVRFNWMDSEETWWMRVMQASSGGDKGHYFVPEIDDDVLVAFQDNNPNKPYVIGSVYNGKATPKNWSNSNNYLKGIKTVSGNEILFNDEGGKETITIQQKNSDNVIVLSLESEGKITLTTKGNMIFKADKSISFKAGEEIKMESGTSTSIKGGTDVKVESGTAMSLKGGTSVEVKGSTTVDVKGAMVTVKGDATAELSASGNTTVKGLLVMIN